jgi:DNA helicase-2/ATP-dependent DNA helicase PcrA
VIFAALETLKTLGFRHDQVTKKHLDSHVRWLTNCGMEGQLTALLNNLSDIGLVDSTSPFVTEMRKEFIPFWVDATVTLHKQGLITFEDQKYWPFLAIDSTVQLGRTLSGAARTQHVIVDEFQDINPLDLALINAFVKQNKASLTIAGDDDQAIYEWRGASPEFILNPDKYFESEFRTFILATNYRSPQNVVRYSQRLIAHNKGRVAKQVRAHQKVNATVEVHHHQSITDCIYETTTLVKELLHRDDIASVALISRKRSQIVPYQITFASSEVPFYAAEDLNISLSTAFRELKEVLAIRGQQEHASPFGPSPIDLMLKLCDKVKRYPLSKSDRAALLSHLSKSRPSTTAETIAAIHRYQGPLKGENKDSKMSQDFAEAITMLMTSKTVADALNAISSHFQGFQQDYGKSDDDIYYTDPPFFYLAALAEPYGNRFADFYNDIDTAMSLLAQVQSEADENLDEELLSSKLHLMTALRAKGREFDAVIVLDANDGIWPSRLAESPRALEQERRLFYVASTRARRYLAYVYSDRLIDQSQFVSPYIQELGLPASSSGPKGVTTLN